MPDGHAALLEQTGEYLTRIERGDQAAAADLMALLYDELRALAGHFLKGQRVGHTLEPTALVHEAFLKLVDQTRADWTGRAHFFAVAARAMRQILIDHARAKNAAKRGGGDWRRVTLDAAVWPSGPDGIDLIALDDALTRLAGLDERQAHVVELRFFSGLTVEEVAHVLGVSRSTVEDEWRMARAWLSVQLAGGAA